MFTVCVKSRYVTEHLLDDDDFNSVAIKTLVGLDGTSRGFPLYMSSYDIYQIYFL